MRSPETPRHGSEAHASALERLDEALEHQHDLADRADAAKGTPGEEYATQALRVACNQTAAREAWLTWIERGRNAVR